MKIKCYNKKCGHERDYKGKFTEDNSLITCTKCRNKLRLGKAKIKSEVSIPHALPHEVTSLPHAESKGENSYRKTIATPKTDFTIQENSHGDKLMKFKDGLKVVIPRGEILAPMIEKIPRRSKK